MNIMCSVAVRRYFCSVALAIRLREMLESSAMSSSQTIDVDIDGKPFFCFA
jgi:hypothetical protein